MNFLEKPNLPAGKAALAVMDGRINENIETRMNELGIEVVKTAEYSSVYESVAYHPDIMIHHLGGNKIVYAPGTDGHFLERLVCAGFSMITGAVRLSHEYPGSAAYNVARVGNYAFHNFNITDPILKAHLSNAGIKLLHVKQGYAKCSVSIINENAIITADTGIASAARENGIDVLLINPEKKIMLPGLDYGFIGGCSGLIGNRMWAVTGRLDTLKCAEDIRAFLEKYDTDLVELSNEPVVDYGSIIPLAT